MLNLVVGVVIGVVVMIFFPEIGTYLMDGINSAAGTIEKATAEQTVVEQTIDRIASIDIKEWNK